MRCLAKDPGDRFQSIGELLTALGSLVTLGAGSTPTGIAAAIGLVPRRRRLQAAAIVGTVAVVCTVALVFAWRHAARVTWARQEALLVLRMMPP